jgi:DNA-binding LacI/PurR family transcriptional regulator
VTTIHDVARLAGVSIKTVSNALNGYQSMKPDTKQRVLDAVDQLGYRPNSTAQSLRTGRSGFISLIIPDLRNPYFAELADSVMRAAEAKQLSVLIQQSRGNRDRELALLREARTGRIDGVLFSPNGMGEADAPLLEAFDTPMVLLGERILNGPRDHVTMKNTEGTKAATKHLLSRGATRILAFGAGRPTGSAGLRLAGYRDALKEADLLVDDSLVIAITDWYRSTGAAAMRQVLEDNIKFDGVVAFNDSIALGAMRILQEAGRKIPDDVAMIGFDDIDETRYSLPTLSSINPGRDEIAVTAVACLVERITKPDSGIAPRRFLSDFELIERESSTVPARVG